MLQLAKLVNKFPGGHKHVLAACSSALNRNGHKEIKSLTSSAGTDSDKEASISGRSKIRSIVELMRLDKPTGTILALTPSLWAVTLASPNTSMIPNLETFAIFTAGAIVARGMGCTLNDILDRNYDKLVERTKMRPIACGDISVKEGLVHLALQSTLGLYILCLNNLTVIKLGLFSGLMISTYPLFKRFTYWPQVMLALTMNWGVLMGYAAVTDSISAKILPIYLSSIFWTLYYDTIYAHQDKTDDMFIGVKSSALKLGSDSKQFLNIMTSAMGFSLLLAGYLTEQEWPYYLSVVLANSLSYRQVRRLNLDSKEDCWTAFNKQKYIGLIVLGGALGSVALKFKHRDKSSEDSESIHS